jgi:hypothetical protein
MMKIIFGSAAALLFATYLAYQVVGVNFLWQVWSSKYECDRAVNLAAKVAFTLKGSEAMKEAEVRCDSFTKRIAATARIADTVITP